MNDLVYNAKKNDQDEPKSLDELDPDRYYKDKDGKLHDRYLEKKIKIKNLKKISI